MSRYSFLTLASLLSASPVLADSQTATEYVVAFDAVIEAPAIAMSARGDGSQRSTETVAGVDGPVREAAIAALGSGSGAQTATEQIAVFDRPSSPAAAVSTLAPERVVAHCETSCACSRG